MLTNCEEMITFVESQGTVDSNSETLRKGGFPRSQLVQEPRT